jgi:leucyl-tRNA---protein transferase
MESLFTYIAPPSPCGYLPEQVWSLEYEYVGVITAAEYEGRMAQGWRHFGRMLFRPACRECRSCRSLRVPVASFRPDRAQRRCRQQNQGEVRLEIGAPVVTKAKLKLYDRYHAFQSQNKGWPFHPAKDVESYEESFARNPFTVQEWCYYLGRHLIGVGYVDDLPTSFSAIYFYYDPDHRDRSLGTFNVLSILDVAGRQQKEFVYLGYFVEGCRSMQYKARFRPNQLLGCDGTWRVNETAD